MSRAGAALLVVPLFVVTASAQRPMPSHTPASSVARAVARVNGVAVTSDRVSAALARIIPQESFHRNVGTEKMTELRRRALSSVIDEELEYQDGVRHGMAASDAELRTAWTATVARNGGAVQFGNVLRQSGMTEADARRELARQIVVEKAGNRAVFDRCGVTRDEASSYFTAHPDRFLEPEQLHIYAITIGVDPSSTSSKWQEAKRRTEEARRALDAGTPFADVARAFSTDPTRDKGGDMGLVHRGALASPFDKIVDTLQIGKPSGVIESLYGYHIVLLADVRPAERKSFDQVSNALVTDLSSARCREQKDTWVAALHASAQIEIVDPAP